MSDAGLPVTQPISAWNKPLEADWKALFKALAKAGKSLTLGQWEELPGAGVDLVSSIGLKTNHGERAYLLIRRALTAALHELVGESVPQFQRVDSDVESLMENADWSFETADLQIDRRFFDHPEDLSILEPIGARLAELLTSLGVDSSRAERVSNRLGTYFIFHLAREWREHPGTYAPLKEALEGPFAEAAEREAGWQLYDAWLQKRAAEPVFGESFSLTDVYVPLRAYWEKPRQDRGDDLTEPHPGARGSGAGPRQKSDQQRVAVLLHEEIEEWLEDSKSGVWVRLLSGGPGSGKSTFARMLSAEVNSAGKRKVLYVPLHQLDVSTDLVTAIERFVEQDRFLTANPLATKTGGTRLLLVLDGLDELALQGKVGAEVASEFVGEVRRTIERLNDQGGDVRVLITGRPVAVDPQRTQFRKPGQVLHALPYQVPEEDRDEYVNQELLEDDQRQLWWRRYGECAGKNYEGLPEELDRDDLSEITRQPLLNYLLALSFERGRIDFSRETSLNQIYGDLLDAVYERQWGPGGPHPAVGELEIEQFRRVLEEIAVAAWHGNGRTASMQEIEDRFRRVGMGGLLDAFAGGAEAGVGRLLLAFYFRRAGRREGGEATFEFTHKSFGEYLVARRIVGSVATACRRLKEREQDFEAGWEDRQALRKWAELTGPTALETNLLELLRQEVAIRTEKQVREWQRRLAGLLSKELQLGLPMDRLEPKLTSYQQMRQWARNAEEALLAVLDACARTTGVPSEVDWPYQTSLGDLICRLRGQRGSAGDLALSCLTYLDANSSNLVFADLFGADFGRSSLNSSRFSFANLRTARLKGTVLKFAALEAVDLVQAILVQADLRGADLYEADLREANLRGAILPEAILRGADLHEADLGEANLHEADLGEANLCEADLRRAVLFEANLRGTDLRSADLRGAWLQRVTLDDDFSEEQFRGTKLSPDQLEDLGLSESQIERIKEVADLTDED